ncbi:Transcription factor unc-86 [Actinomortierella wolfii]|nr:Transcription factor unc-86 [Actinomortierella wolfii]
MSNDSYWRSVVIGCITAIRLAVEDINKAGILPLNITLSMRNSHPPPGSRRQDGSAAMMSAAQLVSHNVSALIGDTFSWLTAYSASMTSALHIPQCSFSSISDDFSSKILYGYFIRTAPIGKAYCDVYLHYVRAMGWRRIGLVYTSDGFGLPLANEIVRRASSYGIQIVHWEVIYLPTSNATAFTRTMDKLRELGSYVNLLLTTDAELLRALEDIHHAGMFQLPYHWITLNNVAKDVITYFSVPGRPSPSNFNGLVMLDLAYDYRGDPEYDKFYDRWLKLDPQQYPGAGPGTELNYYQTRAYSCAQILALGYRNDIERARKQGHNDTYILEQLRVGSYPRTIGNLSAYHFADVQYHGPVGKIVLNHEGDPESGSWVFYQLQNNKSVVVARSDAISSTESVVTIIPGAHHWPGYASATPPDGPNWVLQNLRWREPIAQTFALIATFGMGVSFIVMGIVIWKRKDPVIKASSPYFCVIEIVGIILVYFTIPLRIGNNRVASCMAMPLIIVLGSTLLLGSLVVKNFRIYRIFSNVFYNKYAIKNSILARQMVVILIVCMTAPVLYVITTRPVPTYTLISPTKTAFLCLPSRTDLDNYVQIIFMVFMVIPNLVLLIIAGYLAYSTQHVASNWNQAKAMAYTIYNILFASLICVPTMFFPNDLFRVTLIIQNSIILLAATVSLLVLFGPKLLIMRQRALRARKQSGSSSSTGYNHSSYSQSNSYSQSSSGNGRKDQSATVDRDFCRSQGSAEFSSSPCPHTASGTQQHLPQPTDERDLTAGTTTFGLQQRTSPTSIQTGDGRSHSSAQSGSAGEGGSSPPPLSGRQGDITSLDRGKTSLTTSPYSSSYRTDYFQHPRATLAAMEPVDPLGPGSNFVQLTPLPPPLDGSIGEPQQFDAIRFRTGILGRGHNGHPHNEFDLHVPEEDQVTGHNPHRMAMLIDKQGRLGAGTIPVLVQDMRHFFLRAFSRWRAMRVIVVSSLGMVMLIDAM